MGQGTLVGYGVVTTVSVEGDTAVCKYVEHACRCDRTGNTRIHTRPTRRKIRIVGSNDGSQGTRAGKFQRLSLLVAHPPSSFFPLLFSLSISLPLARALLFSLPRFAFFLPFRFFFVATSTQRGKNSEGVHTGDGRDSCFRRPRTLSLRRSRDVLARRIAPFTALPGRP